MGKKDQNKKKVKWIDNEIKELKDFIDEQEMEISTDLTTLPTNTNTDEQRQKQNNNNKSTKETTVKENKDVDAEESSEQDIDELDLEEMDEEDRLEMLAYLQMKAQGEEDEENDVDEDGQKYKESEQENGKNQSKKSPTTTTDNSAESNKKVFKYMTEELDETYNDIRLDKPGKQLHWSETMTIVSSIDSNLNNPAIINDDIKRELEFYNQALAAAYQGRHKCKEAGIKFSRPDDFFAEMLKTDEHMTKIRQKLIQESMAIKNAEEAKKMRELKKFGKKVQQEKLLERQRQKTQELDKIKLARKQKDSRSANMEKCDDFDVQLDFDDDDSQGKRKKSSSSKRKHESSTYQKNSKRQRKDEKFGFGGKKKFKKSNTAESTDDVRGFSSKKMKGSAKRTDAKKRLGKNRRMNQRAKNF